MPYELVHTLSGRSFGELELMPVTEFPPGARLDSSPRNHHSLMPFDKLRILVLGCGSIGLRHIRNLRAIGIRNIVAFDVLSERRQIARRELEVEVIDELDSAWPMEPQIAFIAASTAMHIPLAAAAARHGCHLFVEKPLSHNLDGMEQLVGEAARRHLVTMVACNMRFHPGPIAVKRLIDEGAVGEIIAARVETGSYLPCWRPWQDYRQSYSASPESGGVILDCIHEIDLALWYLGPARLLSAAHLPARTIGLETDGVAEILIRHDSGVLTSIHLNYIQRDYRRGCRIIGSEGTVYWDFNEKNVRVFNDQGKLEQVHSEPPGWQLNQVYLDEIQHFLSAVRGDSEAMNSIPQARAALELALLARERGKLTP
jgi:predicted dehydrogenase